ncbi:MAG TPA: hypothetical protein VF690_13345, partial [Hymenobacter sp.]
MLSKIKLSKFSLEWRFRAGVTALVLLAMFIIQVSIQGPAHESDKHSALVNLSVLLFSVLTVDLLTSYKTSIASRKADEQRILGFNEMLNLNLVRYLESAYMMTHPIGSDSEKGSLIEAILSTSFPDMEYMYNQS